MLRVARRNEERGRLSDTGYFFERFSEQVSALKEKFDYVVCD
jgi:hypothetical protein